MNECKYWLKSDKWSFSKVGFNNVLTQKHTNRCAEGYNKDDNKHLVVKH